MSGCTSSDCVCKNTSITSNDNETNLKMTSSKSDNDSDIWESDSSDYEKSESLHVDNLTRDLAALKRRHENKGYLDGLTKGNEIGLQSGFDDGYPLGAQLGGLVGELLSETIWKCSLGEISKETKDEAFNDLTISNVLKSEYFDSDLNMKNPRDHPIIKKWFQYYENLNSFSKH